ncbi:MAG: hypothetical protein LAP87_01585 [Acidobacteriia bacterium]|nr:hypothetical protein [Terriglobia bacterium]
MAVPLARRVWIALALALPAVAVQLPVRGYTTADGLPRDSVSCVVPDSRGFLWMCTPEGLARFDGYQFRTYGVEQGLPNPVVNTVVETRGGLLVAGTGAGLAVLEARVGEGGRSRFAVYYPGPKAEEREITTLFEDRAGVLWCGTSGGLYRIRWRGSVPDFEAVLSGVPIVSMAQAPGGSLWMAAFDQGVVEMTPAGEVKRYGEPNGPPNFLAQGRRQKWVYAIAVDREGAVWVGTHSGLCRLRAKPAPDGSIVERVFTARDGIGAGRIYCLYITRAGRLWAGTTEGGASEFTGDPQRPFRAAAGVVARGVQAIGEDRAGNLWIGTGDEGVKRIAHGGIMSYTRADGLARNAIAAFAESRAGDLFAVSLMYDSLNLNRFDGEHFTAIHPALPGHIHWMGWGRGTIALEDREGDWWVATGQGLCRFDGRGGAAALASTPPKAVYTTRDGLGGNETFKLFEDSRGDIWVATNGPATLSRWDRASGSFARPPVLAGPPIIALAQHSTGDLWVGSTASIFRWRRGRLERMDRAGTAPESASALHFDGSGRLWLGNYQGLFRCDHPARERPEFQKVLGEAVACLAEDRRGRIYACTGRGVAGLDPASSWRRRYTTADGLIRGRLLCAWRDRHGDLWFGSTMGASRFTPQPDEPHTIPPVYINSIRSSGRDVPVAERGETAVSRIALRPYENAVEVDFVGLELGTGRSLTYEYMLQGAVGAWQPLEGARSVHFAGLAPGSYRLLVRAINDEGAATDPPASVELFVATPLWRRWWSLSLMAVALAAGLYGVYRWRMGQLLELERVRTRIATDLHDDVGASLSQVAIMSEVVSRRAGPDRQALDEIAATSRELLQSMSEIVWAIDPSHDRLHDLTQRMRWFAGETLSGRGVALQFSAAPQERDLRIGVDTRRQVFLIFKECVNNIARHAHARHAGIALAVEQNHLVLRVEDDGCGFDAGPAVHGHGLRNMAGRARLLGAALELHSRPGQGTVLRLRVPLGQRRRSRVPPSPQKLPA